MSLKKVSEFDWLNKPHKKKKINQFISNPPSTFYATLNLCLHSVTHGIMTLNTHTYKKCTATSPFTGMFLEVEENQRKPRGNWRQGKLCLGRTLISRSN